MRYATTAVTSPFVAGALRPCGSTALLLCANPTSKLFATSAIRRASTRLEQKQLCLRRWQHTTTTPREILSTQLEPTDESVPEDSDAGGDTVSSSRENNGHKLPKGFNNLNQMTTEKIFKLLRAPQGGRFDLYMRTLWAVAFLIRSRGQNPDRRMYSSLIRCLCHQSGSAVAVAWYLNELRDMGLDVDSDICHSALKVESVASTFGSCLTIVGSRSSSRLSSPGRDLGLHAQNVAQPF